MTIEVVSFTVTSASMLPLTATPVPGSFYGQLYKLPNGKVVALDRQSPTHFPGLINMSPISSVLAGSDLDGNPIYQLRATSQSLSSAYSTPATERESSTLTNFTHFQVPLGFVLAGYDPGFLMQNGGSTPVFVDSSNPTKFFIPGINHQPSTSAQSVTIEAPNGGPIGANDVPPTSIARQQDIWLAPVDPLVRQAHLTDASLDFDEVFSPHGSWTTIGADIQVLSVYAYFFLAATDQQIRNLLDFLQARHIQLAVQSGAVSVGSDGFGVDNEGFISAGQLHNLASRIKSLGGTVDYLVLDEVGWHPVIAGLTVDQALKSTADNVQQFKAIFPNIKIGDQEPIGSYVDAERYEAIQTAWTRYSGVNLDFVQLDVDWSKPNWRQDAAAVSAVARLAGEKVSIIFNDNGWINYSDDWTQHALDNAVQTSNDLGLRPEIAVFQSWASSPTLIGRPGYSGTLGGIVGAYRATPSGSAVSTTMLQTSTPVRTGQVSPPTSAVSLVLNRNGTVYQRIITYSSGNVAVTTYDDRGFSDEITRDASGYIVNATSSDPMFDALFFVHKYSSADWGTSGPLTYYSSVGWRAGAEPNALFNSAYYMSEVSWILESSPLQDYEDHGWKVGLSPTPLFDVQWYKNNNKDVWTGGADPFKHFMQYGFATESRDPSPLFSIKYYNSQSGSGRADNNSLVDYITSGWRLGLDPSPIFDTKFYLAQHPEIAESGLDPLSQFLSIGWKFGWSPSPWFDPVYYLGKNVDVAMSGVNPLVHFLEVGWREGRDPSEKFSVDGYAAANRGVIPAGLNPLIYYLQNGQKLGRMAVPVADWTQAFDNTTNIAPLGIIRSSSATFGNALLAVDGNVSGLYADGSIFESSADAGVGPMGSLFAYWQDYLNAMCSISHIQIYGRLDEWLTSLHDFTLVLLDADGRVVDSRIIDSVSGPFLDIFFPTPVVASSVRIQLNSRNYLALAEVKIFGQVLEALPGAAVSQLMSAAGLRNVAPLGVASASSEAFGRAHLAIDGITDQGYGAGSVFESGRDVFQGVDSETYAYWQDSLGRDYNIESVVVYGRTDELPTRLHSVRFTITNSAGVVAYSDSVTASLSGIVQLSFASAIVGSLIKVELNEPGYLALAEVQVFAKLQAWHIYGVLAGQRTTSDVPMQPFSPVVVGSDVTDASGEAEVRILDENSNVTDDGALYAPGLTKTGMGVYRLFGNAGQLSASIASIVFRPGSIPGLPVRQFSFSISLPGLSPNVGTSVIVYAAPIVAPVIVSAGGLTNVAAKTIDGTAEAGSTVSIMDNTQLLGSTVAAPDGSWHFVAHLSGNGNHAVTATTADQAGNLSPVSLASIFLLDQLAPAAPVIVSAGGLTNVAAKTIDGTAEAGSTVSIMDNTQLLGSTVAAPDGSWHFVAHLSGNGNHAVTATTADQAGNLSPVSLASIFLLDQLAPAAPVIVSAGGLTNVAAKTIDGTAEAGSTVSIMDNTQLLGSTVAAPDGSWHFVAHLSGNGNHAVTATTADQAGNLSPVSLASIFLLDQLAPAAPVIVSAGGLTNVAAKTIDGTAEAGSTVSIMDNTQLLGSTVAAPDGSWHFVAHLSGNGNHAVTATTADQAGNLSPVSLASIFLLDQLAPAAPVIVSAGGLTNVAAKTIDGTAEAGSTVSIMDNTQLLGSTVAAPDGSWHFVAHLSGNGNHAVTATTADQAGNLSPVSLASIFLLDQLAPAAPVIVSAGGLTNVAAKTIDGTAEAGSTVSIMDNTQLLGSTVAAPDGSWHFVAHLSGNGNHAVTATTADQAGNLSPVSLPLLYLVYDQPLQGYETMTSVHVTDTTAGIIFEVTPHAYTGPVDGLLTEYIWSGSDSVAMSSTAPNIFLKGGTSSDALMVANGSNVLDGGLGSNFLVGAHGLDGGHDVFFVDGREGGITWSSLVNFHPGDMATLWGFDPDKSTIVWEENQGAPGYTGLTLHSELNGRGTGVNASITLAGCDLSVQNQMQLSSGKVGLNNYLLVQYSPANTPI